MYKIGLRTSIISIPDPQEVFDVATGITFPHIPAELAVVLIETLHLPLFPAPETLHLKRIVLRGKEDSMIPEGVVLNISCEGVFYYPKKATFVSYIPETSCLDDLTYLSPLI